MDHESPSPFGDEGQDAAGGRQDVESIEDCQVRINLSNDNVFSLIVIGLFLAILRLPRTANPSSPDEQELTPETVAFLGPISVLVGWYGIICWTHWGRQQVDLQTIATLEASPRGIHGRVSLQPPPPPIYHRFTPFLWLITSGMAQFKLLGYTWRAPGASTALIQVSTVLCVYVISTAIILLMPMFDPTWSVVGWEGKLTLRGIHWLLVYLGNTPLRQWSKHVLDRVIPLDLETDPLLHSRALCWAAEKLLSGAEADETFCYWILLLATQLSPVKRVFLIERIVGRTMYSSMWDAHTLEYFRTLRPPMRTNLAKLIFDIAVLSVQDLDEFLTSNRHLSPDDILADVCSRTYHLRALGCVAALTFLDRRLRVNPAQKLSLARVFIQLLDVLPPSLSSPESMFPTWCDHSTSENAAPLFIAACVSVFLFLHPILSNIVDSPDAPPLGLDGFLVMMRLGPRVSALARSKGRRTNPLAGGAMALQFARAIVTRSATDESASQADTLRRIRLAFKDNHAVKISDAQLREFCQTAAKP